ncbi:MAG: NAD-dependent epimerase/dehydratase family protein, partial [Candidatus Micrarchaeota archaeon]|nr:NAD-dependent epimerase/dehydratase family protein [Candidatus Micrarchaeota archaeon]
AGFIGSHLVDSLIFDNDVCIVDNLSTGRLANVNKNAKFYKIDLTDFSGLNSIFQKERPEIVFHLAAQINVRTSIKDPILDAKSNIIGSINLLECCRKYNVKRIIYSSSGGAVYGDPKQLPVPETHEIRPLSHYGASKFAVESYLSSYHAIYGLDYITLRYANVYGPRQDASGEAGVIAIFISNILNGKAIVIFGDGEQTRDFVFVKDVVNANLLAMNYKGSCRVFNIGTGIPTSVNKLKDEIGRILNKEIEVKYAAAINGEVKHTYLDINLAKRELKFHPKTFLSEGIKETAQWMENYLKR